MNKLSTLTLLIIISIIAPCCSRHKLLHEVERSLEIAGTNRPELEAVLRHFEDKSEEERKTSQWIIANIPGHRGYDSTALNGQMNIYEAFSSADRHSDDFADSLSTVYGSFNQQTAHKSHDISNITAAFLIDDIEASHYARTRWPWARTVDYEIFLRHVAPYRLSDEPLEYGWRRRIQQRFEKQFDSIASLPGSDDIITSAEAILALPEIRKFIWSGKIPSGPRLGSRAVSFRYGSCQDNADRMTYILRAAGIPAGTDKMLFCGNRNNPHSWLYVIGNDGHSYTEDDYKLMRAEAFELPFVKIHRETFDNHFQASRTENISDTELRALSRCLFLKDVTKDYGAAQHLTYATASRGRYWLCLPDHMTWKPIYPSTTTDKTADFGIVGDSCLVAIGHFTPDGSVKLISNPFVTGVDNSEQFSEADTTCNITLLSKYSLNIGEFAYRMAGGVFETADNADFTKGIDTLAVIKKAPGRLWSVEYPKQTKAHRYIRYTGPNGSFCNVAELRFFDCDGNQLQGVPIGSSGSSSPDKSFLKVFDEDPYTSFDSDKPSGAWVGLDLGAPQSIFRIEYAPRNRDNYVRHDDSYELFRWNSASMQWQSMGIKTATADSLVYNAPAYSLLYLKNHSRGKDERPFIINPTTGLQEFY
ncbi:MAG: hypothetical protein K2F78_03065 [Muribaculaceae bacterium]|nr:hypothetical protein [Muribaculaceae bacterium]